MFNFGVSIADYSKNFDKAWENTPLRWISLIIKVLSDGYSGYRMMATCIIQLRMSQKDPWELQFRAGGPLNEWGILQVKEKPVCPEIPIESSDAETY